MLNILNPHTSIMLRPGKTIPGKIPLECYEQILLSILPRTPFLTKLYSM